MRARAILEPLLSAGVAPSTALSYPPSHYFSGRWNLLGTSVDRGAVSRGCEMVPTGLDPCRPWREQAGHELDQAASVPPVRVFVGDEVGYREANDPPRPY